MSRNGDLLTKISFARVQLYHKVYILHGMSKFQSHGLTLHYRERGRGMPVVLVHGFPLDSRIWDEQLEVLADRYRVIAPDLRGFGESPSGGAFSINSLADDLHVLLRGIDALPCVLVGLSMGGYVVLSFAKKYLKDLRGLGLFDTRAEADTPQGKENRQKMLEICRKGGSAAVTSEMFPKMLGADTVRETPAVAEKLKQIMHSQSASTVEQAILALRDRDDRTADLNAISIPTLIVVGEQDLITPPDMSKLMDRAIPQSTLVVVSRSGHISCMERPEDVNIALRRFLETLGG